MQALRSDVKSGVFVLLALAVGVFLVFSIGESPLGSAVASKTYSVRFSNAAGVKPGALVTYLGTRVGSVEEIILPTAFGVKERLVEVVISIRADLPLESDCFVQIEPALLGDAYLDIKPGSASTRHTEGSPLKGVSPPAFSEVMDEARALMSEARTSVKRVDNILATVEESEQVGPLVNNISDLVQDLQNTVSEVNGILGENRQVLHATLVNAEAAVSHADQLVQETRAVLDTNEAKITRLFDEANAIAVEVNELLVGAKPRITSALESIDSLAVRLPGQTDALVARVDAAAASFITLAGTADTLASNLNSVVVKNDPALYRTLLELEASVRAARALILKIKSDPSMLIFGGAEEPAVDAEAVRRRELREMLELGRQPSEGLP